MLGAFWMLFMVVLGYFVLLILLFAYGCGDLGYLDLFGGLMLQAVVGIDYYDSFTLDYDFAILFCIDILTALLRSLCLPVLLVFCGFDLGFSTGEFVLVLMTVLACLWFRVTFGYLILECCFIIWVV